MNNIFAYTDTKYSESYPAYINMTETEPGVFTVTVRSRGYSGTRVAQIEMGEKELRALFTALMMRPQGEQQ